MWRHFVFAIFILYTFLFKKYLFNYETNVKNKQRWNPNLSFGPECLFSAVELERKNWGKKEILDGRGYFIALIPIISGVYASKTTILHLFQLIQISNETAGVFLLSSVEGFVSPLQFLPLQV